MRRFSIYMRPNGYYYAEIFGPNGERIASRSTGKRNRDEAVLVAGSWLEHGLPIRGGRRTVAEAATMGDVFQAVREADLSEADAVQIARILRSRGLLTLEPRRVSGPSAEPFGAWLRAFWKWDSPYIRERLAHGQRATRRHCQDMESRAREIEEVLGGELTLGAVRRQHLVDLGLRFKARGLAPATINKTISAATTALRWAFTNDLIPVDPTQGLRGFSGVKRRRGILEPAEVKALFATSWEDERARVACLTSATTGARLGEVLALQLQDIEADRLQIRHSYSIRDGLKCTKTGLERAVPLLPPVRAALVALEATSPHPAGPERFIFWGKLPDKPIDSNVILRGFRKALVSMNGKTWAERESVLPEYSARGIDFHSWRHFYATTMAQRLDAGTVKKATGHTTTAMLEEYARHATEEGLARLGVAAGEAFGGVVQ